MNRGAFERRFSRLDAAMNGLRFKREILLIRFATRKESARILELLDQQAKMKRPLTVKTAPEEMAEIRAFFETFDKRLKARLGQE